MAEYIERERAIQKVKNVMATEYFLGNYEAIEPLQRVVDVQLWRMTAADVAPVVHAHWLTWEEQFPGQEPRMKNNLGVYCSSCHVHSDCISPYCSICGAKMDRYKV